MAFERKHLPKKMVIKKRCIFAKPIIKQFAHTKKKHKVNQKVQNYEQIFDNTGLPSYHGRHHGSRRAFIIQGCAN